MRVLLVLSALLAYASPYAVGHRCRARYSALGESGEYKPGSTPVSAAVSGYAHVKSYNVDGSGSLASKSGDIKSTPVPSKSAEYDPSTIPNTRLLEALMVLMRCLILFDLC
jgi:hypothetical protein